jgi:hypothetical protein
MRRTFAWLIPMIFSMTLFVPALQAKKNHDRAIVFEPTDRRTIIQYYRGNYSNLPPGLAKRGGNLPPGLQRQVRRTGHLPPGLEKRVEPFPVELERRLPGLPPIYRRGIIGDRAVIYDPRTMSILDALSIASARR